MKLATVAAMAISTLVLIAIVATNVHREEAPGLGFHPVSG
jgi:hypothetical protein